MSDNRSSVDEGILVRKAIQGDKEAFGDLYEHYLDPIYRYIYYRVPEHTDAEDLTEQVFLNAWEALPKARKIKNFRAWLYRIAHNLVADFHRAKKTTSLETTGPFPAQTVPLERQVQNKLEGEHLAEVISQLEEQLQQVIILRFINQHSHAETANIMGLKEGHVRVLQHRALKQLRPLLSKDSLNG